MGEVSEVDPRTQRMASSCFRPDKPPPPQIVYVVEGFDPTDDPVQAAATLRKARVCYGTLIGVITALGALGIISYIAELVKGWAK